MKAVIERIDALKKEKSVDESFATFLQWKKLLALLIEDPKVGPDRVSAVLLGLTSISGTTQVIGEWLKKAPAQSSTAAGK